MKAYFRILLASFAVTAAPVFSGSTAAAQTMKVGVVDVQRAIDQTEDGMRATALLKKLFDNRQQELSRKEQELMAQREALNKQSQQLSQAAIQKQVETWQKQMLELQTTYVEYNKELQKKQRELLLPVQERVMVAIKQLAMGPDHYDLIVDKATVAFVRTDLDLTDRIIQASNGGGAPPATATATAPSPTQPSTAQPAPTNAAPVPHR